MQAVISAIKQKDFTTLSSFVHPTWIRFSPYEYVDISHDIVLTPNQIAHATNDTWIYVWWSYDGSWDPIQLSINQYRDKFVYDVDFINAPEVYYNQKFTRGNTINTIFDIYTGKYIVEYHFPWFDEQFQGMDWRSLYLIFDRIWEEWKLIAIVHGQRTI